MLQAFSGNEDDYDEIRKAYVEIIALANTYYDLVLVDLDRELGKDISEKIMLNSNIIVANITQRIASINEFIELREKDPILKSQKTIMLIGRYDKHSKYTIKNVARYLKVKEQILAVPYNTLFFEASEEAGVIDLFFRIRKISDTEDRNAIFMREVKRAADNIIYKIQDMAMTKM